LDEYNKLSISGINFHEAKEAIHHDITAARAAISAIVSKDPETTSRVQNALGSLESTEKKFVRVMIRFPLPKQGMSREIFRNRGFLDFLLHYLRFSGNSSTKCAPPT